MSGSLEALEERAQARKEARDSKFTSKGKNTSLEVPPLEFVTSVDYENLFALIWECCGTTPVVHRLSSLAWVSVDGEVHIIECVAAAFICIEQFTGPEGEFPYLFFNPAIQLENAEPDAGFRAYYIPVTWGKTTARCSISRHICERRTLNRPSVGATCTRSTAANVP